MAIELVMAPQTEPVSLQEIKTYLNVSHQDDDSVLSSILKAIRVRCEELTGHALVNQEWILWLDADRDLIGKMKNKISLPKQPLQSVLYVKKYDESNNETTVSNVNYNVDSISKPGKIVFDSNYDLLAGLRKVKSMAIKFRAGYGNSSSVPETLKEGIKIWVQMLYGSRNWLFESGKNVDGLSEFSKSKIPPIVQSLWGAYLSPHL